MPIKGGSHRGTSSSVIASSVDTNAILDTLPVAILTINSAGYIVGANSEANRLLADRSLVGKSFSAAAIGWEEPDLRQSEILNLFDSGVAQRQILEKAYIDGEEKLFRVDKIPLLDDKSHENVVLLYIFDVTEHARRESRLIEKAERYKGFIDSTTEAIWRYDICPPVDISLSAKKQVELLQNRAIVAECNQRMADLFGAEEPNDIIGLPLHRSGALANKRQILKFVQSEYQLEEVLSVRETDEGEKIKIQSTVFGVVENGFLTRAWGTSRDVTLQQSYLDHMEFMATHDTLTSLPNRSLLYRKMGESLKKNKDNKMALLLFDLDRFKEINDTLGHLAGDHVLKELGPRLEAELLETPGLVARLGGDEFAVFLPNIRNVQQAVVLGHRFLDAIRAPFELEGVYTEISASVGISIAPDQAADVSTMMRYADVAMYHAKSNLKGVSLYDSEFDSHSPVRLEISGALGRAVREKQLFLQFQPKVRLADKRVYGFEALVRWQHPEHGLVPPSDFVPIAEASNVIYALTLWVLDESVKQCALWRSQGLNYSIAMNLSPRNLLDERIVEDISEVLERYRVPGACIEMEITESMIMSEPHRAQVVLDKISALGVRLAVDDFGTGYSSLAYLKRLPVQSLKIDMSFIRNMLNEEQDAIIVHSTIQLAHNLGLEVVAEGIESLEVMQKLTQLGCNFGQGYHIGRPMMPDDLGEWFDSVGYL